LEDLRFWGGKPFPGWGTTFSRGTFFGVIKNPFWGPFEDLFLKTTLKRGELSPPNRGDKFFLGGVSPGGLPKCFYTFENPPPVSHNYVGGPPSEGSSLVRKTQFCE